MVQRDDRIIVKAVVHNTGEFDGDEVVQVYIRRRFTSVKQPERELKAYKRVMVKKGEKVAVEFELLYDSLCYHNIDSYLVLENCNLDVMVGSSSDNIHAEQTFELKFIDGIREVKGRVFSNKVRVVR
jgi:beta-glucosidase